MLVGDSKNYKAVGFDAAGADLPPEALKDAMLLWSADAASVTANPDGSATVLFNTAGAVNLSAVATWPNGASFSATMAFQVDAPLAGPPAELVGLKIAEA